MKPLLRLGMLAAVPLLVLATLAACSPAVPLDPAKDATNPKCADVMVHLPQSVDDMDIRQTDAQATSAWGDPAAIVLRCGVTPPGPTSAMCYTVAGVDWIIDDSKAPVYTFTTYGRTPAVQVVVDSKLTDGQGTVALDELGDSVGYIKQSSIHKCEDVLGGTDPEITGSPTPSPTPTP